MTIQTLFDRCMLHDNQLDLIAGGDDVTRGLTAINLVQDWFEEVAAEYADVHQTDSTFTTTASTEKTAWPTGLKRLDALWLLDANGRQVRELDPIDKVGGHAPSVPWPIQAVSGGLALGAPSGFYAQQPGGSFFWDPTPDAVYTLRGYGLWAKANYTAAADTFLYPDGVALVLVPHATVLFRIGLERDIATQQQAAQSAFRQALSRKAVRVQASSRVYADVHDT